MHYVLEVLFPFLVLLYLIDCIAYVRYQHLLFSSHFGRYFKLKKSGLHIIGLLPISEVVISHNLPIFLTSRGFYTRAGKPYTDNVRYTAKGLRFIAYEDVVTIEVDGKVIKVNGEALLKFPTSTNAQQMMSLLRELTYSEVSDRHRKIREFLRERTDLQKLRATRENCQLLAYVKMLSSMLFVIVFGILPLALYSKLSLYVNLAVIVYLAIGVYLLIIISAYIERRELFGTTRSQTLIAMLPTVLSPVTGAHILKDLTKEIFVRFDYIAIAAALLPSQAFHKLMREELLRTAYAKEEKHDEELKELWVTRENVLHNILSETGIEMHELFAIPKKRDPSAVSYCPLCLDEYRYGPTKCIDCEVQLKEYGVSSEQGGRLVEGD